MELQLTCVFSKRVLPSQKPSPQTQRLSLLDNVSSFAPKCRALFAYDATSGVSMLSAEIMESALSRLLSEQPIWSGQLQWVEFRPEGGYKHRLGCLEIKFGEETDPGVGFAFLTSPLKLCEAVPSFEGCLDLGGAISRSKLPYEQFFNSQPIATNDPTNFEGSPIFSVQMIQFACGGITIAIIVPHYLGDATAFTHVIQDIATLIRGENPPVRQFDPESVDRLGGALSASVDREIFNRHLENVSDFWASGHNAPPTLVPACTPPPQVAHFAEPLGHPMNWEAIDFSPTLVCHTFFTPEEIHNIYLAASANGQRISHLDAFKSHIWLETCNANEVEEGELQLVFPVDLRRRANLPAEQIGCIVTTRFTELIDAKSSIDKAAASIRAAILTATPEAISELIYCLAYETTPTRYLPWAPKTKNTTILTSWMSEDIAGTDFGMGKPRYFDTRPSAPVPNYHILIAMPSDDPNSPWYKRGAVVATWLKDEQMEKWLSSKTLHKYR